MTEKEIGSPDLRVKEFLIKIGVTEQSLLVAPDTTLDPHEERLEGFRSLVSALVPAEIEDLREFFDSEQAQTVQLPVEWLRAGTNESIASFVSVFLGIDDADLAYDVFSQLIFTGPVIEKESFLIEKREVKKAEFLRLAHLFWNSRVNSEVFKKLSQLEIAEVLEIALGVLRACYKYHPFHLAKFFPDGANIRILKRYIRGEWFLEGIGEKDWHRDTLDFFREKKEVGGREKNIEGWAFRECDEVPYDDFLDKIYLVFLDDKTGKRITEGLKHPEVHITAEDFRVRYLHALEVRQAELLSF